MAVFLGFAIIFTAVVGKEKILEEAIKSEPEEYKGIITMWQVDSFEGGVGSRKQFLLKVARGFEKKHDGALVMVTNYTMDGVIKNLNSGIYPDIISFGIGTEVKEFSELAVKTSFLGGKVGNVTYAVPWCRGGYVLIYNPSLTNGKLDDIDTLIVSQGEYTQPLLAAKLEGIRASDYLVLPPMDAYVKFVSGKVKYLLGTQRDISRLKNRGMDAGIVPLEKYNDLYQYAVVTSKDNAKKYYAEEFINYLVSESVQEKLTSISMYSVEHSIKTDDEQMKKMQNINGFSTISAFTPPQILKELQTISKDAILGDEKAANKIKNMLILP